MEGVSSEQLVWLVILELGKLIMLYDSNDISLDGPHRNMLRKLLGTILKPSKLATSLSKRW